MIKYRNKGITLIELLVTLVVSLILIATGLPGMGSLIKNNRLTSTGNQMITDLSRARNEAIKRGKQISLCPANSQLTGCSGDHWEDGWLLFIDLDTDEALDAGEEIILTRSPRKKVTIRGDSHLASSLHFSPRGVVHNDNGTFSICDSRNDITAARKVVVAPTGRVHVKKGVSACP